MNSTIPTYRLYGESGAEELDFWLHFEDLPARSRPYRWEISRHRHGGFFQIFTISKGGGELVGEGTVERFEAPCLIFIPAGAVHGFRFEHESDGTVLTVRADKLDEAKGADRRFIPFFLKPRILALGGDGKPVDAIRRGLERMRQELACKEAGRMALVSALLTEILIHLARQSISCPAEESATGFAASRDAARMEALGDLIDVHFREHRPIAFYAARLGISPTHLNRLCRLHFGESVRAMIDRKFVSAAKRELVFSRHPAQSVAFSLGFSDPAYFNRFFRKNTGMTPGRYRATQRQETGQ